MRVPLEWLKEFVEIRLSPEKLAHLLTMGGIEVESIERLGRDTVFEIGITPNRADCLSMIGIAREVAAVTGAKLKLPARKGPRGEGKIASRVKVSIKNKAHCPRYTARLIEGVSIGPSPAWMAARLAACGIRSINNVVDATNYVMLEMGHPLHAFDFNRIRGGRIEVKLAEEGAQFATLDGMMRRLEKDDLMICDADGPVAIAGIMGGAIPRSRNPRPLCCLRAHASPAPASGTHREGWHSHLNLRADSSGALIRTMCTQRSTA